jgi:hypothetical protein
VGFNLPLVGSRKFLRQVEIKPFLNGFASHGSSASKELNG